jgi:hypothetical protein
LNVCTGLTASDEEKGGVADELSKNSHKCMSFTPELLGVNATLHTSEENVKSASGAHDWEKTAEGCNIPRSKIIYPPPPE